MFNRDVDENLSYTEEDYNYDLKNLLDLLAYILSSFVLAPFRFFTEFATKVVFLGRENIRKTVLIALVLNTIIVVWNLGINIFIKHSITILDSYDSIVVMGLSFVFTLVLYFVICLTDPVIFTYEIDYDEGVEVNDTEPVKPKRKNNTIESIKQNAEEKINASREKVEVGESIYDELDFSLDEPEIKPLESRSANDLGLDFDEPVPDMEVNLSELKMLDVEKEPEEIDMSRIDGLLDGIDFNPPSEKIDSTEDVMKNEIDLSSLNDFDFGEYM